MSSWRLAIRSLRRGTFARPFATRRISPNLRTARWEIARAMALDERWDEYDALVEELLANGVDRPMARARYSWWKQDWARLESLRVPLIRTGQNLWPGLMENVLEVFL